MLKELYTRYREAIDYLIFGVLTTVVNYIIYYLLYPLHADYYVLVNAIAWAGAVAFAYVTNRKYVFLSKTRGKAQLKEMGSFVLSRVATLGLEEVLLILLVEVIHLGPGLAKLPVSVITVIGNYVLGKFLVFGRK